MSVEVVTKEDLQLFRIQIVNDLKSLLSLLKPIHSERIEGYKTADVRRMLKCSINKLVSLRVSKKLRTKKIGGTLYYNKDDVRQLLHDDY